jgi:hypothetical protein
MADLMQRLKAAIIAAVLLVPLRGSLDRLLRQTGIYQAGKELAASAIRSLFRRMPTCQGPYGRGQVAPKSFDGYKD